MSIHQITFSKDGKIELISTWHPVDGVWRHITQTYQGDSYSYYTDGKKERGLNASSQDNEKRSRYRGLQFMG